MRNQVPDELVSRPSRRKQKDKKVLKKYSKLHLDPFLEMKTLFSIVRNNGYLKQICKKKNSKPQKNERKIAPTINQLEVSLSSVKFLAIKFLGPDQNF